MGTESHDPLVSPRSSDSTPQSQSKWLTANQLTVITAMVSAVLPLTTWISGIYRLQLDREKQRHEIRMNYLDRTLDPGRTPEARDAILNLLLSTLDQADPLAIWALSERGKVSEVLQLRSELATKEAALHSATAAAGENAQLREAIADLHRRLKEAETRAQVTGSFGGWNDQAGSAMSIRDAKLALVSLGLFNGKADDKESPEFRSALMAFQKSVHLPTDGLLSSSVAAALRPHLSVVPASSLQPGFGAKR